MVCHRAMVYLPRGIDPELLVSQVQNTMPYLFEPAVAGTPLGNFKPAEILRAGAAIETHLDYFKLCVSSHFLSCATPVPTDVDNQIRLKLWPEQLPVDVAVAMADFVLGSRDWDYTQVSTRWVSGIETSGESACKTGSAQGLRPLGPVEIGK